MSNWACFHALDNFKNLFYANIVQLLAHFLKILYQLLPVWLWWGPVFVYRWKLSPVFLTETDNSQNSCFSSKQPSWVLSLNTDPPTHQAPRHHYFRGNSDRRLNIIPLKNRSVYLVICCAIRLQSNYNGAELLDNYEWLPSGRFRLNIDPHWRPLGDPWSIGHLGIAIGPRQTMTSGNDAEHSKEHRQAHHFQGTSKSKSFSQEIIVVFTNLA